MMILFLLFNSESNIIPEPFDKRVVKTVAKAVKDAAVASGVAKLD